MRAQAHGIDAASRSVTTGRPLDNYRNRTLLKAVVTAEDVAEATLFPAGPRSAKATGATVPVDGGVKEAFPR